MSTVLPQTVRTELDRIATAAAVCFAALPSGAMLTAMALLCQRIAEETNEIHEAAKAHEDLSPAQQVSPTLPDVLKPVPVPPEVLAEAIRTFDAKEVADAIHEIREGGGRKFEDFMPELERMAAGQELPHRS